MAQDAEKKRRFLTWRWLVPIALAAAAALVAIAVTQAPGPYPIGGDSPLRVLIPIVLVSPTILYYRLLIFLGERLFPPKPVASALLLVLAGAVLPPLLYNARVAQSVAGRDFVGPAPPLGGIVAIDTDARRTDLQQRGFADCDSNCLMLLFGGGAQGVIVGDASADRDWQPRFAREISEPALYPSAQLLRIERRATCPPVTFGDDVPQNTRFPGGPVISRSGTETGEPSLDERVIGLMASGQCLLARPAAFRDATLRLGWRNSERGRESGIAPDGFGLVWARYRFVDRRGGAGWARLSQRTELDWSVYWTYPFAILPRQHSWFAARSVRTMNEDRDERGQPWRWAGITLPTPPAIDTARVRELLGAAVALPATAPRDARHQLARQYLRNLARRQPDATDRALLPRLIMDPRVRSSDLQPLDALARRGDAVAIGLALIERIRRTAPGGDREIQRLGFYLTRLPRAAWPALLPALRTLAADPDRAGEARSAFELFTAGSRADADYLLRLFQQSWPPLTNARTMNPSDERKRIRLRSADQVAAYLEALCMVADKSPAIRPALLAASRTPPTPDRASGAEVDMLWRVMAAMGINADRPATGQGPEHVHRPLRDGRRCPPPLATARRRT